MKIDLAWYNCSDSDSDIEYDYEYVDIERPIHNNNNNNDDADKNDDKNDNKTNNNKMSDLAISDRNGEILYILIVLFIYILTSLILCEIYVS